MNFFLFGAASGAKLEFAILVAVSALLLLAGSLLINSNEEPSSEAPKRVFIDQLDPGYVPKKATVTTSHKAHHHTKNAK